MDDLSRVCGCDVSRETQVRLTQFAALVEKWSRRINLVAPSTLPEIWTRHIVDSAQLLRLIKTPIDHYVDLGSGGGFPSIILAVLLTDSETVSKITLVESDTRKSVFLRQAARDLGLDLEVKTQRIETLEPLHADLLTARALAPMSKLASFSSLHLKSGGFALFPKGRRADEEISAMPEPHRFELRKIPSLTNPEASIVELRAT